MRLPRSFQRERSSVKPRAVEAALPDCYCAITLGPMD